MEGADSIPVGYTVAFPSTIITYGTEAEAEAAARQLAAKHGREVDVVAVVMTGRIYPPPPPPPANDPEPEPLRYA